MLQNFILAFLHLQQTITIKENSTQSKVLSKGFLLQEEYHVLCGTVPGALVSSSGPKGKVILCTPSLSPSLSVFWFDLCFLAK